MKKIAYILTACLACLSACSCEGKIESPEQVGNDEQTVHGNENSGSNNNNPLTEPFTIHYTTPVPSEFFQAASEKGKVETLWYDSKDYTKSNRPATYKPAYVYLPYGYDASQKYDVIYLQHGWTGTAEQYFGLSSWPQMKNLFDNLIEKGLTRPFIAVSPTWDKDNQSKGWDESTEEAAVFSQEYVNDLIPAIEMHYSTYLEKADKDGILASRTASAWAPALLPKAG